jgi:hypothetical protein
VYIRGAWAAFAKAPTTGLIDYDDWPQYSTDGSTLMRLAFNNLTGKNLDTGNAYDEACTGIPSVTSGATPTAGTSPTSPTSPGATVPSIGAVMMLVSGWWGVMVTFWRAFYAL